MLSIHFYSFSFSHSILISSFLYQYSIFYYDYDIVDFNRNTIIEMKMMIWIEHNSQYVILLFKREYVFDQMLNSLLWIDECDMNEYTNKNEIIRMKSDKINCVFISLVFLNDLLFHKDYLISRKIEFYSFLWIIYN